MRWVIYITLTLVFVLLIGIILNMISKFDVAMSNHMLGEVHAAPVDNLPDPPLNFQSHGVRPQMQLVPSNMFSDEERTRRSPRPGERCYKYDDEIVISHGANGECRVIDTDMIVWMINPLNRRTPINCKDYGLEYLFHDSWEVYYDLNPLTTEHPHPVTAYLPESYEGFACTSWGIPER